MSEEQKGKTIQISSNHWPIIVVAAGVAFILIVQLFVHLASNSSDEIEKVIASNATLQAKLENLELKNQLLAQQIKDLKERPQTIVYNNTPNGTNHTNPGDGTPEIRTTVLSSEEEAARKRAATEAAKKKLAEMKAQGGNTGTKANTGTSSNNPPAIEENPRIVTSNPPKETPKNDPALLSTTKTTIIGEAVWLEHKATVQTILEELFDKKHAEIYNRLSSGFKSKITRNQFTEAMESSLSQAGSFDHILSVEAKNDGDARHFNLGIRTKKDQILKCQITLTENNQISNIWIPTDQL